MTLYTPMAASIFSQIIARELPGHFVYEDDLVVVILDKFPSLRGQMLVIPRQEVDYVFDLDDETYHRLFAVAKRAAAAADTAFDTARTCLVTEGFEVPHVHIKLYPMPPGNIDLAGALKSGPAAADADLAADAALLAETLKAAAA